MPKILKSTSKWTDEPQTHPNLYRRLSFEMSKAIAQKRQAREREVERRRLEVENERRTQELEEARRLQLSMLPRHPPRVPGLDIAFRMLTATEVGGDYYDFRVGGDAALLPPTDSSSFSIPTTRSWATPRSPRPFAK